MHIGLIGGIGPAATDYYYRLLINTLRARGADFDITIVHADSPLLIANQIAGREAEQADIFARLTERLALAGADTVAVTSIAGHFCIERFTELSPLPVNNLITAVRQHLREQGYMRVGSLGTEISMRTGLYGMLNGFDCIAPDEADIKVIHDHYLAMANAGRVNDDQRTAFLAAGQDMVANQGAEAILLGGTDLVLAFDGIDPGFAVIDCAKIHALDIANRGT